MEVAAEGRGLVELPRQLLGGVLLLCCLARPACSQGMQASLGYTCTMQSCACHTSSQAACLIETGAPSSRAPALPAP